MARKDVKEITDKLERGVKDLFGSDRYKEYLTFMGKFHNYSANNILLIMLQRPDASLVAGYEAWRTKFKRQVRKGEHGITILAPCQFKREVEGEDGETKVVAYTSFKTAKVFDISQTDGEELPTGCVNPLAGTFENYEGIITKLEGITSAEVKYQGISGGANGYFSPKDGEIVIKTGMSQQQTIKTLIHEIAHSILHDVNGEEKDADRRTREVQAESVAYTVCQMIGLDASEYSFGYIAGWSKGKELKELTDSMKAIQRTASIIGGALAS